jgi:hypothetical protein
MRDEASSMRDEASSTTHDETLAAHDDALSMRAEDIVGRQDSLETFFLGQCLRCARTSTKSKNCSIRAFF